MAERLGLVSEITPGDGNRPYSAKVGNRKIKFWGTEYQSQDPSAALVMLRDAENRGKTVRVEGAEEERQGPKGPYKSFTASQVYIVDGVAPASASNGSAPAPTFHQPDSNRDRSIVAQVAYKVAATLAGSGAVDISDPKTSRGSLEAFKSVADYIFYSILETAEGKATGSAEPPASPESSEWSQP